MLVLAMDIDQQFAKLAQGLQVHWRTVDERA